MFFVQASNYLTLPIEVDAPILLFATSILGLIGPGNYQANLLLWSNTGKAFYEGGTVE